MARHTVRWVAGQKPGAPTGIIRPPVTKLTRTDLLQTDHVVVKVKPGILILPARLPHLVDANPSGTERISTRFNVMFSAYSETLSRPLWEP